VDIIFNGTANFDVFNASQEVCGDEVFQIFLFIIGIRRYRDSFAKNTVVQVEAIRGFFGADGGHDKEEGGLWPSSDISYVVFKHRDER
jgi:hypothetical protein